MERSDLEDERATHIRPPSTVLAHARTTGGRGHYLLKLKERVGHYRNPGQGIKEIDVVDVVG